MRYIVSGRRLNDHRRAVAKLILFPSGTLDNIPLAVRIAAAAGGFVAFICIKRSVFAAVLVGEAMLLLGGFLFGR
jgi:hypothetical protein